MCQILPILFAGQKVGEGHISRSGLYHRFECRFRCDKNHKYYLYICFGDEKINLGICIPDGDDFVLKKNLASKTFTDDEMSFLLLDQSNSSFCKIFEKKPFPHIAHLEHGVFEVRNNMPGIRFRNQLE